MLYDQSELRRDAGLFQRAVRTTNYSKALELLGKYFPENQLSEHLLVSDMTALYYGLRGQRKDKQARAVGALAGIPEEVLNELYIDSLTGDR